MGMSKTPGEAMRIRWVKPGSYICTDMPPSNGCVLQRCGASHGHFLDHFDGHKQ